jgi:hypothetical protein
MTLQKCISYQRLILFELAALKIVPPNLSVRVTRSHKLGRNG